MTDRLLTIFEAVNSTLKEIYVGATDREMHRLIDEHRSSPPSKIAHWKLNQVLYYCSVEFNLPPSAVDEFIAAHVLKIARPEWKIIAGTARSD